MQAAAKIPTLADLDALPAGIQGEIIEGVLYTKTRPRSAHQYAGTSIAGDVGGPFDHVDVDARAVVAYRLDNGVYVETGVFADEREARIDPFEAVPLEVVSWWA